MSDADALDLVEHRGGTLLRIRVKAGARMTAVVGVHDGALKLAVTAAPERGRANKSLLTLLAKALNLAPSSLEITSGHTTPSKTILVPLSPAEARHRLTGGAR
jgi:uncharacterized protein (TIGR00251 family)